MERCKQATNQVECRCCRYTETPQSEEITALYIGLLSHSSKSLRSYGRQSYIGSTTNRSASPVAQRCLQLETNMLAAELLNSKNPRVSLWIERTLDWDRPK